MYLCEKSKAPGTAYRQTECTGCPQGSSKELPCPHYNMGTGHIHLKTLSFLQKTNLRKERGKLS